MSESHQQNIIKVRNAKGEERRLDFSLVGFHTASNNVFENETELHNWIDQQHVGEEPLWKHMLKNHYSFINGEDQNNIGQISPESQEFRNHIGHVIPINYISQIDISEFPEDIRSSLTKQTSTLFGYSIDSIQNEGNEEKKQQLIQKFLKDFSADNELCRNSMNFFCDKVEQLSEVDHKAALENYINPLRSIIETALTQNQEQNIIIDTFWKAQNHVLNAINQVNAQDPKALSTNSLKSDAHAKEDSSQSILSNITKGIKRNFSLPFKKSEVKNQDSTIDNNKHKQKKWVERIRNSFSINSRER
jgi:hypothetical protein